MDFEMNALDLLDEYKFVTNQVEELRQILIFRLLKFWPDKQTYTDQPMGSYEYPLDLEIGCAKYFYPNGEFSL